MIVLWVLVPLIPIGLIHLAIVAVGRLRTKPPRAVVVNRSSLRGGVVGCPGEERRLVVE